MGNRRSVRSSLSFLYETLNWPIDPYPFAVDEAFDAYRLIVESCEFHDLLITRSVKYDILFHFVGGELIGMSGKKLSVIMCGDSA